MAKYIDKVDLSELSSVIKRELQNYQKDVYNAVVDTCKEGIEESKKFIQKDMKSLMKGKKEDGKHYRSSFSTHKKTDTSRILWNKNYQLSHLLEDGHYVYNQHGGAYEIHPQWPLIFGYRKNGDPIVYGSEYGTSGKVTIALGSWDKTEEHTAEFVEKKLYEKLK